MWSLQLKAWFVCRHQNLYAKGYMHLSSVMTEMSENQIVTYDGFGLKY